MKSLKESGLDTTTAHGKMLFTIFAGIAQFVRDLTSERTKEGIQAARKREEKSWKTEVLVQKLQRYLRDHKAAKRFFKKALRSFHVSKPRVITVDKNPSLSYGD